jgi:hypothetical protein
MATRKQEACLSKEFSKLAKNKKMKGKQKIAIALKSCKIKKSKTK